MYKIIGGDGKEYGPVSEDQLRQWISQGRVIGETRAALPGMTEWKPLRLFPEFAALFVGFAATPGVIAVAPIRRVNGFAVTGMIFGILGLLLCCCSGLPFNLLGLIFSIIALVQIHNYPQTYDGRAIAVAGVVLSVLSLILGAVWIFVRMTAEPPSF